MELSKGTSSHASDAENLGIFLGVHVKNGVGVRGGIPDHGVYSFEFGGEDWDPSSSPILEQNYYDWLPFEGVEVNPPGSGELINPDIGFGPIPEIINGIPD
jgi:hypothetical protein